MSDFQLILLEGRPKLAQRVPAYGPCLLLRFQDFAEIRMSGQSPLVANPTRWIRTHEALAILSTAFGDSDTAKHTLLERLKSGMVTACAESSAWVGPKPDFAKSFIVPDGVWRRFYRPTLGFWESGDIDFNLGHLESISNSTQVWYHAVRFDRADIEKLAASASPQPPRVRPAAKPAPTTAKGGRPRKEWWDDFWIAICGEIYEGNLKPKRQADLERAMLNWATKQGHEMSEATAKKVAKRLFAAWKLGG